MEVKLNGLAARGFEYFRNTELAARLEVKVLSPAGPTLTTQGRPEMLMSIIIHWGPARCGPVALYTLALDCLTCLRAVAVDGLVSPECMDAEFGGWACLGVGWKWDEPGLRDLWLNR